MKLATFTWSYTVEVPDDFNEEGTTEQDFQIYQKSGHNAFLNVQEKHGEFTDLQEN